jgi:hypothetical protein
MRRGRVVVALAAVVGGIWSLASCVAPTQQVTLSRSCDPGPQIVYTLTDGAPFALDVNYVSLPSAVLSSTHLGSSGGTATLVVPNPSPEFTIWYTFEGGPAPTSSVTTTLGTAVPGVRPLDVSSGPPSVASGIITVPDKFACVGTALD